MSLQGENLKDNAQLRKLSHALSGLIGMIPSTNNEINVSVSAGVGRGVSPIRETQGYSYSIQGVPPDKLAEIATANGALEQHWVEGPDGKALIYTVNHPAIPKLKKALPDSIETGDKYFFIKKSIKDIMFNCVYDPDRWVTSDDGTVWVQEISIQNESESNGNLALRIAVVENKNGESFLFIEFDYDDKPQSDVYIVKPGDFNDKPDISLNKGNTTLFSNGNLRPANFIKHANPETNAGFTPIDVGGNKKRLEKMLNFVGNGQKDRSDQDNTVIIGPFNG